MKKGCSALFGRLVASAVHKRVIECQVKCPGNQQCLRYIESGF
jgi:hypothetical protein